jgi:hypothetical protein
MTAASHALVAQIAERVGPEALAATWADVAEGTGAYQPPTRTATGEGVAGPADWRRVLDLLEANAGTTLVDLWRDGVVTQDQASELDARASARLAYQRTLAIAGDWQLPRAVRDALRAWQFETADAILADSRTVLSQRNAVADLAERDGLALPGVMQGMFEEGALAEASAYAEAERAAMAAIAQARASRSADDDLLSRLGMLGENPDAELSSARASLAQGDLPATFESADRAQRAWTVAWQEGRRRALLALAVLATVAVLASAVVAQVRRSRRPGGGAAVTDSRAAGPATRDPAAPA